jgi:hypothetical protein
MTSGIPVVQGVAVPSGGTAYVPASSGYDEYPTYGQEPQYAAHTGGDFNGVKGDVQPKKFNDAAFAFLFVAHLVSLFALSCQLINCDVLYPLISPYRSSCL